MPPRIVPETEEADAAVDGSDDDDGDGGSDEADLLASRPLGDFVLYDDLE